ncbi:hypothetical protein MPTK2_7g10720 [Marchantia polymorpha subsp. ruderalis]
MPSTQFRQYATLMRDKKLLFLQLSNAGSLVFGYCTAQPREISWHRRLAAVGSSLSLNQNNADSCWNLWWGRHCGADAGPALMVDGVGMEKH